MKTIFSTLLVSVSISLLTATTQGAITGHWTFEDADLFLSAKIGLPITEADLDTAFDQEFGTTGQGTFSGVPDIAGQPVRVMKFPKTGATGGYFVPHGADANGGGASVNQYTIIMDVLFPAASSGKARALFQLDTVGNADFFVNDLNQVGLDGASFQGTLSPDTWHRVALAVNLAASPTPLVAYFVDGVKVFEGNPGAGVDSRFAIPSGINGVFLLVNDDNSETELGYISSLQFRDEKVADVILTALGGPTADGILTGPLPNPYVVSARPSPETARIPERSTVTPQPLIELALVDGTNAVDLGSITMRVDGALVTPMVVKSAETNRISYLTPTLFEPLSLHAVRVDYQGLDGRAFFAEWVFAVGRYVSIPAEAAGPPGSANTPGFRVRTVQAPMETQILNVNSLARAIKQLNGTLTDTGGGLVANVAIAGPNSDGSYNQDLINYHLEAGTEYGAFNNDLLFPGIPGSDFGTDLFATEVLTYLELTEGVHRLGVSVSVDRTDTGTDDGFSLFAARDPRNPLSTVLGSFARNVANAFANLPNFNEFNIFVPADGVYCVRLLQFQTFQDSSLEFYSLEAGTTNRIAINDPVHPQAIKAFRVSTAPFANKPYVAEVNPPAGAAGVSPLLPIEVLLLDDQTQVDTSAVQLFLNGASVAATVMKTGNRTTVFYQPDAGRTEVTNQLRLVYRDNASPTPTSLTNDWQFTIAASVVGQLTVRGQWDFDSADLTATVGQDLEYLDGPAGMTASGTQFGTTTDFGISDIGGQPATVMCVPGGNNTQLGYTMRHGIGANGGGTRVNQFTLIYDIYFVDAGPGFASFINFDVSNTSDGDFFWRRNDGGYGQGGGGYEGNGVLMGDRWHRVAFAVDMAANPPVVTKFLDGVKHSDQLMPNNQLDGARRTLPLEGATLFGDEDGERHALYVSSIQVREGKLSEAELAALGGPSADGIPQVIPPTTVRGQWDFTFAAGKNLLGPTVGSALEYLDGEAGMTASGTQFGTTTDFAIPDINGQVANVMCVPGGNNTQLGYTMRHGIGANGGGTRVNQFTLIYDIYFVDAGPGFASFINFDASNTSDGDFFWRRNDGGYGQGGGGYEGNGVLLGNTWHRVAFAVDMAANPPVVTKFLDGVKHADQLMPNNQLDGARRTLPLEGATLFGDEDGERHALYVSSIQVREGKMSEADLAALGGPSAAGIPVALPHSNVQGQWDFDFAAGKDLLGPTVGSALEYLDGEAGMTASGTQFGTTTDFAIPDIGGQPAKVMCVPGGNSTQLGYILRHGIGANGGGTRVNQFTLIYDIYFVNAGPGFASFVNFDVSNTSDGDFFWRRADGGFGQGGGGYEGDTVLMGDTWHRVAFAVDMAANPPVVTKFLDGVKHADQLMPNNQLDGARRTMPLEGITLFGDEDGERHPCYVSSIQVRGSKLSDAELAALGGPSARGIPLILDVPDALPAALITFQRVGDLLIIEWPGALMGFTLEATLSLTNSDWQPVAGVVGNRAEVTIAGASMFFRLRQ